MANFVTDYSNLAAAGSAFNSFADAYSRAQDSQMKRQEMQARIESEKTKAQRENDQTALSAAIQGKVKNAQTGNFDDAPMTPKGQMDQQLKAAGEGYKYTPDPSGGAGKLDVDPTSPKMVAARNAGLRTGNTLGTRQDNQSIAAVKMIHEDKALGQMRNQAASIDKGIDTLNGANGHKPSWLEVNEVAQDVANALSGGKGSSDFKIKQSEQASIAQKLGDLKGYATSNPDQPADQAYVDFYKQFADRLKGTYDHQMAARAQNLTTGAQKAFKHNPDAFAAMQEAAGLYKTGAWRNSPDVPQLQSAPAQYPQQTPPHQGGLVKPQGFLSKAAGLLGIGSQPAAPVQQPAQDPDIAAYAKQYNLDYAHAAAIIAERKAKVSAN